MKWKTLKMRVFPTAVDEWMSSELWVGVTPSRWSPVMWAPMKRGSEGSEAKGREVYINPYKTL